MTHRLATNYAKNYCNRTPVVKVIVENVVTCFLGDTVYSLLLTQTYYKSIRRLTNNLSNRTNNRDIAYLLCGANNNTYSMIVSYSDNITKSDFTYWYLVSMLPFRGLFVCLSVCHVRALS